MLLLGRRRICSFMATGLVIHISSGDDKHTEVLTGERVRIGNCDDCDLRLRASALPKRPESNGLVIELAGSNGSYHVMSFDPGLALTLNGQPVEVNAQINDGDELTIGTRSCRYSSSCCVHYPP